MITSSHARAPDECSFISDPARRGINGARKMAVGTRLSAFGHEPF